MIFKYTTLLAVLAAAMWFGTAFSWGSGVALLAALSTYVGLDRSVAMRQGSVNEHDRQLFQSFVEAVPPNSREIEFLEEYDLGNSFRADNLVGLQRFVSTWDDVSHEFNSSTLEKARAEFLSRLDAFLWELAHHTSTVGPELLSIGISDISSDPQKLALRDQLNAMATAAFEAHQEVIRHGKKRFGILW